MKYGLQRMQPTLLENTTWKAHVHAEAIWEALLSHGREHFSQVSNTPLPLDLLQKSSDL
jgi:hypothetical protein